MMNTDLKYIKISKFIHYGYENLHRITENNGNYTPSNAKQTVKKV